MPTETNIPQALERDHVRVIVDQQFPELPAPGTYVLPIGMVHGMVLSKVARIHESCAKEFEAFCKSTEAAQAKLDARNQERMKAAGVI